MVSDFGILYVNLKILADLGSLARRTLYTIYTVFLLQGSRAPHYMPWLIIIIIIKCFW